MCTVYRRWVAVVALILTSIANAADPAAPTLEFIFEEHVLLGEDISVGETPMGERNIVPIIGGTFEGPGIRGSILPNGWDWQLKTAGGCFLIEADYMIKTDDGVVINVLNNGRFCESATGEHSSGLTTPVFEAPKGKYDWLNGGAYVGTLVLGETGAARAVHIRFYRAVKPSGS